MQLFVKAGNGEYAPMIGFVEYVFSYEENFMEFVKVEC